MPNTAVVSVIDLELDDGIHVGTQGLKRAGQRLARIAERELFGQLGATTPTFDRVTRGPHNTLVGQVQRRQHGSGTRRLAGIAGGRRDRVGRPWCDGRVQPAWAVEDAQHGAMRFQPGEASGVGLKPERHIAGFSIRKEDGTSIPLIFEAGVGKAQGHGDSEADRTDPRERRRSGTATGSTRTAT